MIMKKYDAIIQEEIDGSDKNNELYRFVCVYQIIYILPRMNADVMMMKKVDCTTERIYHHRYFAFHLCIIM